MKMRKDLSPMYDHTLYFNTRQHAIHAEVALMLSPIDCSNVEVETQSPMSTLSFQTTYKLGETTQVRLKSGLRSAYSSFNNTAARRNPFGIPFRHYEEGLRASDDEWVFRKHGTSQDMFTEQARNVLSRASAEAQRFQHHYIGTEHLLLALMGEGEGTAATVLANLGVELHKVRSAVEFISRGDRNTDGEMTLRAKKVIELARDEARRLNHHSIGTEHLLLGLVLEGEGMAVGVLECLGVNLAQVRRQTMQALSQQYSRDAKHCKTQNGCRFCAYLEEEASNGMGDVLFFLDLAVKFLGKAALSLVAIPLALGVAAFSLMMVLFFLIADAALFLLIYKPSGNHFDWYAALDLEFFWDLTLDFLGVAARSLGAIPSLLEGVVLSLVAIPLALIIIIAHLVLLLLEH